MMENCEAYYWVLFRIKLFVMEFESGAVLFMSVNNTTVVIDCIVLFGKLVTNCWKPFLSALNPFGIDVVLITVPFAVYNFMVPLICLSTVSGSVTEYVVVALICRTFLPNGK